MFILQRGYWTTIAKTNELIRAYNKFYNVVGCIGHDLLRHELDVDFTEDGVDMVLRHLLGGKNLNWYMLTIDIFK